jgi:ferritin-like metal-binding protein YciE
LPGIPQEDAVTLFQVLELMERDLEEERATSQDLREENDESVNDNWWITKKNLKVN